MNHQFTDPIPSDLFTYHAVTRTFVAKSSDIWGYINQPTHEDPRIRGFAMRSKRTGKILPFYFVAKLQDLEEFDGEVFGWKFVSDWADTEDRESFVVYIYDN